MHSTVWVIIGIVYFDTRKTRLFFSTLTYRQTSTNYFVDILLEKTLAEIEIKKNGDKSIIEVYESYKSHIEKLEIHVMVTLSNINLPM